MEKSLNPWIRLRQEEWRSFSVEKAKKKKAIETEIENTLELCDAHGGEFNLSEKYFLREALSHCWDGLYDLSASAVDDLVTEAGISSASMKKREVAELQPLGLADFRRWLDELRMQPVQETPIFWRPQVGRG